MAELWTPCCWRWGRRWPLPAGEGGLHTDRGGDDDDDGDDDDNGGDDEDDKGLYNKAYKLDNLL